MTYYSWIGYNRKFEKVSKSINRTLEIWNFIEKLEKSGVSSEEIREIKELAKLYEEIETEAEELRTKFYETVEEWGLYLGGIRYIPSYDSLWFEIWSEQNAHNPSTLVPLYDVLRQKELYHDEETGVRKGLGHVNPISDGYLGWWKFIHEVIRNGYDGNKKDIEIVREFFQKNPDFNEKFKTQRYGSGWSPHTSFIFDLPLELEEPVKNHFESVDKYLEKS